MKKAWLLLVLSSLVFWGLKFVFPKEKLFSDNKKEIQDLLEQQKQDALEIQQMADSMHQVQLEAFKKKTIALQLKEKRKKDSIQRIINRKRVNRKGLNYFFSKLEALENNKNKQVRIAFYGDSMEDADMIVMHLRHYLQKKFGGKGVGYVPITSVTASGRYSIKHTFTNWNKINFMHKGFGRFPFGLNGNTFYVGDSITTKEASVTLKKGNAYPELSLINPILFYGKAASNLSENQNATLLYQSDNTNEYLQLHPKYRLNTINLKSNTNTFSITVKDKQTIPFYGFSVASKNGVIVDNLSVRGNSGLPLTKLNTGLMQDFNKHFNYDLVILAYGTNVFSFKNEKYGWYKSRMLRTIKHMQRCFPKSDILIFSMGDRSTKIDGTMQTPAHLPDFINLQFHIAKESNSGFFSLYEQMGGFNSMVKWVEEDKLAGKDYTHFTPKGAKKAGNLLYTWFMNNYATYKKTATK